MTQRTGQLGLLGMCLYYYYQVLLTVCATVRTVLPISVTICVSE